MSRSQQIVLLAALILVGGFIWVWQYWPAADNKGESNSSVLSQETVNLPAFALDRWPIERRHRIEYEGMGCSLFSAACPSSRVPARPTIPRSKSPVAVNLQPVDLPARFFGYGAVPVGTPRRAFLVLGEEIYVVSEGDMLMGRYRIVKINNSNLEFEEVSSGRHGQKAIEDQGPNA